MEHLRFTIDSEKHTGFLFIFILLHKIFTTKYIKVIYIKTTTECVKKKLFITKFLNT